MATLAAEVSSTVLPARETAVSASPKVSAPLLVKLPASVMPEAAVAVRPPRVKVSVPALPRVMDPVLARVTGLLPNVLLSPVKVRS